MPIRAMEATTKGVMDIMMSRATTMLMPTTPTSKREATMKEMSVVVNTKMNITTTNTTTKEHPLLGSIPTAKDNPDVVEIRKRIQRLSVISP